MAGALEQFRDEGADVSVVVDYEDRPQVSYLVPGNVRPFIRLSYPKPPVFQPWTPTPRS
jgi:hypothetical protein